VVTTYGHCTWAGKTVTIRLLEKIRAMEFNRKASRKTELDGPHSPYQSDLPEGHIHREGHGPGHPAGPLQTAEDETHDERSTCEPESKAPPTAKNYKDDSVPQIQTRNRQL